MNVMPYDKAAFDVHVAMIDSSLGAGHSTYLLFFFVFLPFICLLSEQKSFRHYCAGRNTRFQNNARFQASGVDHQEQMQF
jgi:hypothetical protein